MCVLEFCGVDGHMRSLSLLGSLVAIGSLKFRSLFAYFAGVAPNAVTIFNLLILCFVVVHY